MAALITNDEARRQLRLTESNMSDADIAADVADKALAATDIVIDYIKQPDHNWDATTAPSPIKSAILLVLTSLFYDRDSSDPISAAVKSLVWRYRDPALA